MTWQHQAYVRGYAIEPITAGDLVETYARSWRERLLTWPWRPWARTGVRKSTLQVMIELREQALEDMRSITGLDGILR